MIQLQKTSLNQLSSLREAYLNSLPEFQEYYLEMLVEQADCFQLFAQNSLAGYVVVSNTIQPSATTLVEYYLLDTFIPESNRLLKALIDKLQIKNIFCKSFDAPLLGSCLELQFPQQPIGLLFRDRLSAPALHLDERYSTRLANLDDYNYLVQQEGELFDSPEQLKHHLGQHWVTIFEQNNKLVGCGYHIHIHPQYSYTDLGMWTHPDFRNQGVASYIVSHLIARCLAENRSPICGCAIDNLASQRTLEKNGFISKHKLLEFEIN